MAGEKDIENAIESEVKKRVSLAGEFLVEFLGGLIPGILFSIGLLIIFVPSLATFLFSVNPRAFELSTPQSLSETFRLSRDVSYMWWLGVFTSGLLLSYVFGHLFYRRDPKEPNKRSYARITKNHPTLEELQEHFCDRTIKIPSELSKGKQPSESEKVATDQYNKLRLRWLRENYACDNERECEFPFSYMHDYLRLRGHHHLLPLVLWAGNSFLRSKTFINLIKIRLQFYVPEKYKGITRNEAHVRLSTSTWYMAKSLERFAGLGIALWFISSLVSLGIEWTTRQGNWMSFSSSIHHLIGFWRTTIGCLLPATVVLFVAFYCSQAVEKFIHYQRIREVFYVLETAYTALKAYPGMLETEIPKRQSIWKTEERRKWERWAPKGGIVVISSDTTMSVQDISLKGIQVKQTRPIADGFGDGARPLTLKSNSNEISLDLKLSPCWNNFDGVYYRAGYEFIETTNEAEKRIGSFLGTISA